MGMSFSKNLTFETNIAERSNKIDWQHLILQGLIYWKYDGFQMVWVVYWILLTIPVIVASAERSFSKLKLIKLPLGLPCMSLKRLSELVMSLIKNEYLDKWKYDNLIEDFVSKNAKRSYFL